MAPQIWAGNNAILASLGSCVDYLPSVVVVTLLTLTSDGIHDLQVTVKHHPLFPHRARRFKCVIKGTATTSVKESGFDSDCCLTVVLCVKIGMVKMLAL